MWKQLLPKLYNIHIRNQERPSEFLNMSRGSEKNIGMVYRVFCKGSKSGQHESHFLLSLSRLYFEPDSMKLSKNKYLNKVKKKRSKLKVWSITWFLGQQVMCVYTVSCIFAIGFDILNLDTTIYHNCTKYIRVEDYLTSNRPIYTRKLNKSIRLTKRKNCLHEKVIYLVNTVM